MNSRPENQVFWVFVLPIFCTCIFLFLHFWGRVASAAPTPSYNRNSNTVTSILAPRRPTDGPLSRRQRNSFGASTLHHSLCVRTTKQARAQVRPEEYPPEYVFAGSEGKSSPIGGGKELQNHRVQQSNSPRRQRDGSDQSSPERLPRQ